MTSSSSRLDRWRLLLGLVLISAACSDPVSAPSNRGLAEGVDGTDQGEQIEASARQGDGGLAFGVAVPGSKVDEVRAIETAVGSQFELVRLFARWDDDPDDFDLDAFVADGYRIHLSIRPRTNQGESISWAQLADATPGSAVYGQLQEWIDRLVKLPAGTYVTINHEPETSDSQANGSSEDFVAMWRRVAELIDENGGQHLELVWVVTGGSFRSGRADDWYPGDDVVDVVGADTYNWFTCQGTNREWRSLDTLIEAPLAFARDHGKPLALPEVASVEDPAVEGRKADWLDEAGAMLSNPDLAEDVAFVAWFDVTAPGGVFPDCVWDFDSSPSSAEAFGRLARSLAAG